MQNSTNLTRDYLRDIVTDIRCARRDGLTDYAKQCEGIFRILFPSRHQASIDRYGMPRVISPAPDYDLHCNANTLNDERRLSRTTTTPQP